MAENGKGEETKVQFCDGLLFRMSRCMKGEDTPKLSNILFASLDDCATYVLLMNSI